jgi:Ca2+-binding RTX toxin-like protein
MFESLESRMMFDGGGTTQAPVGISFANGIVTIKGDFTHDTGTVSLVDRKLYVTIRRWAMTDTEKGPAPLVYQNAAQDFDWASVQKVLFYGLGGNDAFTNDTSKPSYAAGGSGEDKLTGGSGSDELHGNGDDDKLYGREGNDSIWGDAGGDLLVGGAGSDHLQAKDGVHGNDFVYGDNLDGTGGAGAVDLMSIDQSGDFLDFYTGIEGWL